MTPPPPDVVRYGPADSQRVELWLPTSTPTGTAIVLHGGYWRDRYDLHLMDALCADLRAHGWLAANVEYRRVGDDGGGWPATFDDVDQATMVVLVRADVDPASVVAIGHSAGGQLALLLAARQRLAGVVGLAPVSDLREASRRGLSDHAVHGLLGGSPAEHPHRYRDADPMEHLPLPCPTLVVHADDDVNVPVDLSEAYVAAARRAGGHVDLQRWADGGHFAVIDPDSGAWQGVRSWLMALTAGPSHRRRQPTP